MKKSSVVGKNEENKRKCKEKQVLVINSIILRKKRIDIRPKRLKDFFCLTVTKIQLFLLDEKFASSAASNVKKIESKWLKELD
jgi:hypothetical protein